MPAESREETRQDPPRQRSRSGRWSRILKRICFASIATFFGLALIEGTLSLLMLVYDAAFYGQKPLPERQHSQYDPDVGWVNSPGTAAKDVYGQGLRVTINAQGFRNDHEIADKVPEGKTRIVCSGDSFTLGYGVGDADSWCAQMETVDPSLEVVNMGQGGYGLDQAYLWYSRDAYQVPFQIHFVCLNYAQLDRMLHDRFLGYGKPILKYESGLLESDNVPVPRRAYYVPWVTQNARLIESSRTVQLLSRVAGEAVVEPAMSHETRDRCAMEAIKQMRITDGMHGCKTIVIWIPAEIDFDPQVDRIRVPMLEEVRRHGMDVIDMVDLFRSQSDAKLKNLYIQAEDLGTEYIGAAGHFTPAGNEFVARELVRELEKLRSPKKSPSN